MQKVVCWPGKEKVESRVMRADLICMSLHNRGGSWGFIKTFFICSVKWDEMARAGGWNSFGQKNGALGCLWYAGWSE